MKRLAISTREAAELIGVTDGTIRKWIAAGKIRAVKFGDQKASRVFIPYDQFAAQFGGGTAKPKRISDAERDRRYRACMARKGRPVTE